jgi:hypothetical protein
MERWIFAAEQATVESRRPDEEAPTLPPGGISGRASRLLTRPIRGNRNRNACTS